MADFCAAEAVSVASYYYWRKRLGAAALAQRAGSAARPAEATGEFIEIDATPAAAGMRVVGGGGAAFDVRLDLGGGVVLQIMRR